MRKKLEFYEFYEKKFQGLNPLIIYNTNNLTEIDSSKSFGTKLVNLINPDETSLELFKNGTKTNSEILDEYLVKLKGSRWTNKIVIIQLSDETTSDNLVATISKVKMFIDFQKSTAQNIVIPVFSSIDKKFSKFCELETQLNIFNSIDSWSLNFILDEYISKGRLSEEGHDIFSKKLLNFLLGNVLNVVFEKRDDMRIQVFDIEQQLFKIHEGVKQESIKNNTGELQKQVIELKEKIEEKDREIFRETSLRLMISKKLDIQKAIVKNNYPDEFKKFDSLKKQIQSLQDSNSDLTDNLEKFREENSKLHELNPKKSIL